VRLEKGGDPISDLGNAAAVLKKRLGFYWVGFYLLKRDRLVLGPFQGNPACVFLEKGKGVCWASVQARESILVPDVHQFEGHIACDPNSQSEIVIPLFDNNGILRGVLDADQNVLNAFDETDRIYLEKVAEKLRPVLLAARGE
jgi:L-methionine (R)-S-oxide reductase